ncbi:unnamed protein product [Peronospora destructor]|uniref:Histidine ammonia-lyase n=1 Tax=Peronospora destructor TaxID=86335 RepID=A0AAV0VCV3_9STRA|nr:unnamed protein product [Peronospora destructor]
MTFEARILKNSELVLDGESLCTEDLVMLSKGDTRNSLSEEAWKRVAYGRNVVDNILKDKSRGHSNIRVHTLEELIDAFNADCLTVVPSKGTVGVSGDFAPLAHLALGLMDEGPKWDKIGDQ